MATTTNPSRLGQANLAGDERALFLKVFGNMVMNTFEKENKVRGRHTIKTIGSGKSAQFPVLGTAQAAYHTAGQNILDPANGLLNNIEHAEKVINIDKTLMSPVFIADIDEKLNHYEFRSTYSMEVANALSDSYEQNVLKVGYAAARSASSLTRDGVRIFGGTRIFSQTAGGGEGADDVNLDIGTAFTTGIQLTTALNRAKVVMDKKNIPVRGRVAFVSPEDYGLLVDQNAGAYPNPLMNQDIGGVGNIAQGIVPVIAGFEICMTNNLSNGFNLSAVDEGGQNNDVFGADGIGYNGDFTKSRILCMHPSAVGTVEREGMAVKLESKIEYDGDLLVTKYLVGHGILRPEAAIEITDGNLV